MNKLYNNESINNASEKYLSIFFFGIDGTGKSSVARKLVEIMTASDLPVVLYDNIKSERKNPFHHSVLPDFENQCDEIQLALNAGSYVWQSCAINNILKNSFFIRDRWIPDVIGSYLYKGKNTKLLWEKYQENRLILVPDISFLLTVNEDVRTKRVMQKSDMTSNDLDTSRLAFLSEQLRQNLSSYPNVMEIDTTTFSIEEVGNLAFNYIKKVTNSS